MWPFRKKQSENIEESKGLVNSYNLSEPFYNEEGTFLGVSSYQPITIPPRRAYYLNDKNNALGKATGDIAEDVADLEKGLFNKDTKDISFDHQIISDLENPGGDMTGAQFWISMTESFLLTEEVWIVARGRITAPPQEIIFLRPYDINVTMSEAVGLPAVITTMSDKDRNSYERQEINGKFRYIDRAGLNELIPIIRHVSTQDEWRGRSKLTKLFYDIDMNTEGKRHNVSLLKNGMRTSGVMSPKPGKEENTQWSEAIVKGITKRLRGFNQGAGMAGNVFVTPRPTDYQSLIQNNTDMDYVALLQNSEESIYNLFKIPLPLVLSTAMTLDNYKEAIRQYYLRAVFPNYKFIANALLEKLRDRYGISNRFSFTFSEVAIRAMQPVLVENMKELNATQAIKKNEIRAIGGFEPVEGGDTILVSANLIPLESVSIQPEFPPIDDPDDLGEAIPEEDDNNE